MIETGGRAALLFDPGCIYGDADMVVNRAGKSWHLSLRDLVKMHNGGGAGRWGTQTWRSDIPTMVQREAEDGSIRLVELLRAWESGVKQTFTVTTESGRSIRATAEHPFLTSEGWRRLDELQPGDLVHVRGGRASGGRGVKPRYRERAGLRHHPHAYKKDAATSPYRVAEHRLVVEADMNGMKLAELLVYLRTGTTDRRRAFAPRFLRPDQVVHHIDGDPQNNRRENLQVMTPEEHHRLHADEGKTRHVLKKAAMERVQSIVVYGEEETFDIEVADHPHNFVADGFVVHNTGKTATTLDYCSLLALKAPTGEARVLVVCPLAAVDTWVQQAEVFVSPQVHVWAEALGGSLIQRGESLAARGGNPFRDTWLPGDKVAARAVGVRNSWAWYARASESRTRPITITEGPNGLGTDKPRLVIEVVNLDTFTSRRPYKSGTMADYMVNAVRRYQPDLVIVDESHKIKSAQGNASRLLARIAKDVPRRVILTGTVMPHSPLDVFGQWRFLDPYAFGSTLKDGSTKQATFTDFKYRYAVMGGYMGHEVTGFRNLDDMREIMGRNAAVARKAEALDLPATMDVEVPVELAPAEKKAYIQMKESLAATLSTGTMTVPNRLSQMLRLRQITSGYLPDSNGVNHILGASKVKTIDSIVHDNLAGEKRIVVFALFTQEIEMLRKKLERSGTEVMVITGGTAGEDRMAMRKRFGDPDIDQRIVLVAQIKTLSLAVNELVTANHCIFASLSQQRDDLIQARDRLNRIGQTRPVTFWYALAPGTVDMVIMQSHRDRTDLEDAMLAHILEENR